MKKSFIFITLVLSYVSSLDVDELIVDVIQGMNNKEMNEDFQKNIDHQLTLNPHYFDFTPFRDLRDYTFDCDTTASYFTSSETPKSVHQLRPGDIKVVGAMGDSITAACGANATTFLGVLVENRGRSWSVGGEQSLETVVTMPNILKKFNPNLFGYSRKEDQSGLYTKGVGFNAAISGSYSRDVIEQASFLIENMKNSSQIDFDNDWKLVTLFIGGNDLCVFCGDPALYSSQNYVKNVQNALDLLAAELPRTFVNLVSVINITDVK